MAQIVVYARVSKPEQNIEHQKDNLWSYTTDILGYDPAENEIDVLADKRTGTNTNRDGYREMMRRVRGGEADAVVVRNIRRLGRSMREISENAREMIDDNGVGLYTMNDPIEVDPGDELNSHEELHLSVLAWAAQVEAENIRENTIAGLRAAEEAGKWTSRPPYGFTTDDEGYLQPNENFQNALEAIQAVEDLDWSHRKAARHSGVPRRTVPALLERKDLYMAKADS